MHTDATRDYQPFTERKSIPVVATSFRWPLAVYEQVYIRAREEKISVSRFILAAIQFYLDYLATREGEYDPNYTRGDKAI